MRQTTGFCCKLTNTTHNKRRVRDLLAEEIPEDEAKLLCNGRFACLVCSQRPVFDTVNMLAVHRNGKRHSSANLGFMQKKKELETLHFKRASWEYRNNNLPTEKQGALFSHHQLCLSRQYDPRVKKRKLKIYDRKPCLDVYSLPQTSLKVTCNSHCQNTVESTCTSVDFVTIGDKPTEIILPITTVSDTVETTACPHDPHVHTTHSKCLTEDRQQLANRYHQLCGSGWKKDWDGKWICDEEAEFDSDEEPPDLP